jgi:hypothetical protein
VDVEACRDRNVWTIRRRANRREPWIPVETPTIAQWESLVDLLQRKYQRRRCAWGDVEGAQIFLDNARQQEPNT